MKEIEIKLLSDKATLPTRSYPSDSGLDLYAAETIKILPMSYTVVNTDISINIPKGYEAQVRPRSGVTSKTGLRVQLGTIDQSYHGNIGVIVDNINYCTTENIRAGDKIAQLVIVPIETPVPKVVDDFGINSDRGSNGFGSTGGHSSVEENPKAMQEEMVVITKREYESLKESIQWLEWLDAAGIDNTSAYEYALEMRRESEGE